MLRFRRAGPDDARAIAAAVRQVFPRIAADERQAARALAAPDNVAHVAVDADAQDAVVGFVDGFATRSPRGELRWEVDLVGVLPSHQGRGAASRLIALSGDAGAERGCPVARALIRHDNAASQRAFARCGFAADPTLRLVYVCSANAGSFFDTAKFVACDPPADPSDWLIPVETLTYRGGWIEAEPNFDRLQQAVAAQVANDWDSVGVLVPAETAQFFEVAQGIDYEFAGTYQWWLKSLQ